MRCFVLRALGYILRLHILPAYCSYSLRTASALARLAAASWVRRACSAGCVWASEVGSERIIAHLVRGAVGSKKAG